MSVPSYDHNEPARLQENDWDCSVESTEWALYAWGRSPDDDWLEQSMIAAGVVSPAVGLCDASGAGLARWVNTEYGEYGYWAENVNPVSFDDLAGEALTHAHPIMAGGRAFYHWVGVRGYDPGADRLLLANPAPGWMGIWDTMTRGQFAELGSFSMVRLTHPEAEAPAGTTPPPPDLTLWEGRIGTGLLEMMTQDQTYPAQTASTWLPLGQGVADVEEAYGVNGTRYVWLLRVGQGLRFSPDA